MTPEKLANIRYVHRTHQAKTAEGQMIQDDVLSLLEYIDALTTQASK